MKRLKQTAAAVTATTMLLSVTAITGFAKDAKDIVIFYDNDVHCAVESYSKLAALKNDESESYTGIVSAGDFIQGGTLGTTSKGGYIIDIMNEVGYDAVTLGNHEFDFGIPRLKELLSNLNAKAVACNITDKDDNTFVEPYTITSYGDTEIAYIGVTTPVTLTTSSPKQFLNENGEYIYDFSGDNLATTVQNTIDDAKEEGADYVVVLSHLGTEDVPEKWRAQELIKNTDGIDVVIDGHSHSTVENMKVADKSGDDVILTSTGTKFENIGKLKISPSGDITTELIKTAELEKTDKKTDELIEKINNEYKELGERKVGESKTALTTLFENGERAVRIAETNLGDLCADAYRTVLGADIGLINGGGIRADIDEGEITFNEVLSVFPFNNNVCTAEVTGEKLLDVLEFSVSKNPEENGGFMQVSGLKFSLDNTIPTPVKLDDKGFFNRVEGERRIKNVKVLNKETGEYEPIDLSKTYTVASHEYLLKNCGDGYTMFEGCRILGANGMLDNEMLEIYIKDNLGGVVGEEYRESQNRINVLDEYIPLRKTFENKGYEVLWFESEPKTVYVNAGDIKAKVYADTFNMSIGNDEYLLDRMTYIDNGVTYISNDASILLERIAR